MTIDTHYMKHKIDLVRIFQELALLNPRLTLIEF
jgi:hypothetical protein